MKVDFDRARKDGHRPITDIVLKPLDEYKREPTILNLVYLLVSLIRYRVVVSKYITR